jgi:hypothetical protein
LRNTARVTLVLPALEEMSVRLVLIQTADLCGRA